MKVTIHLILVCFLLTFGCEGEGDNYLKGSIADSFDMKFEFVRARLYDSALSIEYVTKGETKTPIIVTVSTASGPITTGKAYDLKTEGSVSRGEGYGSQLPEVEEGELTLSKYSGEDGSAVVGTFNAIFITAQQNRQTLRGGFDADLVVVE